MQDDYITAAPRPEAGRRTNRRFLTIALIGAVALGGAVALAAAYSVGWVDLRSQPDDVRAAQIAAEAPTNGVGIGSAQTALGVRLAELEQRMTRLNLQAEAASGNAARAEGLL